MLTMFVHKLRMSALLFVTLVTVLTGYGQSGIPSDMASLEKALAELALLEPVPVTLPDKIMRQAISEILRQEVKAGENRRVVLVSENGIKKSWMPKIRNVEFTLISPGKLMYTHERYYSFDKLGKKDEVYSILSLVGAHPDGHIGTFWNFGINGTKVVSVERNPEKRVFVDY